MARIRIGHSPLTFKKESPPQSIACDCCLTIKHILFDFVDFIETRNSHFNVNSFKELFVKGFLQIAFYLVYMRWVYLLIMTHFKNLVSFEETLYASLLIGNCSLFCEHFY